MKKLLNLLLFLLTINSVYSQYCPFLGPNVTLPCGVNSTTLTADLSQCGNGSNPNQTTNYSVSPIPYVAQTNTGNQLFMTDDSQQGPFPIGFTFCFFGQTYTQFYVGSNGWISFSPAQPTTFSSVSIPSPALTTPKNCIMGPWQDWHPGLGGQIRYQTSGVAPCRKLTVSWINVPMFSCTNLQGNFHIVIYESSNNIENYIQTKPNCLSWPTVNPGSAVQGLHNLTGTTAVTVPGRNGTVWTANNDAYKYTPSGPPVTPVLTWYQVGNPIAIGTGPTITVNPLVPTQYTCHLVYPTCNAGWSTCNAGVVNLGPDTILVVPTPNLPIPTVTTIDPLCHDTCSGVITVTPIGGLAPYTMTWSVPGNGFSSNGLCPGAYTFTLNDANGCFYNGTATINNPPQLQSPIVNSVNPVCFSYCNGQSSVNPVDGLAPYTFLWSNNQTTQTATGLCAGNYSVLVLDANNCPASQTTTLVNPPQVILNPITGLDTICFNSTNNLYQVSSTFANLVYNWTSTIGSINSGQTTPQINLDVTGVAGSTYPNTLSVIGYDVNGCFSPAQNFTVTVLDIIPQITQIGPFCDYDDCQLLSATPINGQFSGQGVSGNQICPQQATIPVSQVTYTYVQSGCTFITTSDITIYPQPLVLQINPDDYYILLCDGEDTTNLTLSVTSDITPTTNYWYATGDSLQSQNFNRNYGEGTTLVSVVVEANGCYSEPSTTSVNVDVCPELIYYIPNSFTPDADQFNPTFGVVFTDGFNPYEFHLEIYNRWGEIIWESNDALVGWDGTYGGYPCQAGLYTYKIRFGNEDNDGFNLITGHLNLIR